MTAIEEHKLMSLKEVLEYLPISKSTLWLKVKDGEIREPIQLGRKVYWKQKWIIEFIGSLGE